MKLHKASRKKLVKKLDQINCDWVKASPDLLKVLSSEPLFPFHRLDFLFPQDLELDARDLEQFLGFRSTKPRRPRKTPSSGPPAVVVDSTSSSASAPLQVEQVQLFFTSFIIKFLVSDSLIFRPLSLFCSSTLVFCSGGF